MNKQSLEQWISQLDEEGYCDISDKQVEALIRGFAALEEQRDELAAECASTQAYLRNGPVINKGGELLAAHQFAPATPATDAFLREVRAQGVEEFVKRLRDSADIYDKNGRHEWADHNRVVADDGNFFAAELRKGGAA